MKNEFYLLLTIAVFLLSGCGGNNKEIFQASDELYGFTVYSDSTFNMIYNGINSAEGKIQLQGDTIILHYREGQFETFEAEERLTSKLFIDRELMKVLSIDENTLTFTASISKDFK